MLWAKIETMLLRNKITPNESNPRPKGDLNPVKMESILSDTKKTKYWIGLYPGQFELLYDFLGPAKYEVPVRGRSNILF